MGRETPATVSNVEKFPFQWNWSRHLLEIMVKMLPFQLIRTFEDFLVIVIGHVMQTEPDLDQERTMSEAGWWFNAQGNWPPRRQCNILQRHQQTLSLHIGKGQVDAAWNEQSHQYLLIQKSGGALIVAPLHQKWSGKRHSSPFWEGNLEKNMCWVTTSRFKQLSKICLTCCWTP